MEFYNVFNRSHLAGPVTYLNIKDPNDGQITNYAGGGARVGQFGARFTF
jgi:uncharacterized membrane protein